MASADFALWPVLLMMSLFALMFVGGSAGSTGGSIKVVRHLLLGKILRRELGQTVSPEVVLPIRLNGAAVDERTLRAIATFILLYVGAWAVGSSVIAVEAAISGIGLAPLDAFAISATTLGNVGPAFGITGPNGLVRSAWRRLQGHPDCADVDGSSGTSPRPRSRDAPLLASLIIAIAPERPSCRPGSNASSSRRRAGPGRWKPRRFGVQLAKVQVAYRCVVCDAAY